MGIISMSRFVKFFVDKIGDVWNITHVPFSNFMITMTNVTVIWGELMRTVQFIIAAELQLRFITFCL